MKGEARVLGRRWRVRQGLRVRSEMDGDSDGNRLERSRERENMEGVGLFRDRFKTCEGKTKTKAVQ